MFSRPLRSALLLTGLLLGLTVLASPAVAQSQSDLREANRELRTEVEDLQAQLNAALAQITQLQTENTQLRAALRQVSQGADGERVIPELEPEEVTIDESDPLASPRALLGAIKNGYAENFTDMPMGDTANSAQRTAYLRALARWTAKINREFRKPIEWNVRIIGRPVVLGRGFVLRLQAVDPVTDVALGDAFDTYISRAVAINLEQKAARTATDAPLILRGTLTPRLHVNEDRLTEGPFNNPVMVGVFSEFQMTVTAKTLLPPVPVKTGEEEAASEGG